MKLCTSLPLILSGAMLIGAIAVNQSGGQDAGPGQSAQEPPADRGGQQDPGMLLISGLKQTPGCLGVDTGRFMSGKQAIVAWFKDKKSLSAWYYSDAHTDFIDDSAPGFDGDRPLQHVPDDVGPIMVIATLTMSDRPHFEGLKMPVSQIAIELFKPLPGGVYLGGRFAPDTFKVPHMRNLAPAKDEKSGN